MQNVEYTGNWELKIEDIIRSIATPD